MLPFDTDPSSISELVEESYVLERAGEISAALQLGREALAQARAAGSAEDLAAALVCVAYSLYHMGHYDETQSLAEEALEHAPPVSRSRADALRLLGDCAHESGDLAATEQFYHRACDLARQLGYHQALHRCLHSLSACVYIPRGQFELALAADKESLRLAVERGFAASTWFPLATLGWVYRVIGQRERALAVAEEMRRSVRPGSLGEGYWYCLCADLAQEGEEPAAALPLYAQARSIAEALGDPGLGAELRVGLSRYHRVAGNGPAAFTWADDALNIATAAGCRDIQGWALIARARAAWQNGTPEQAEADLNAAIALLRPMGAHFDLARAYLLLAALLRQQGRPAASSAWLEAVSRIVSGGYAFLLERERGLAFPLLAHYLSSEDPAIASLSARLLDHLARVPPPPLRVVTLGRFEVRQGTRLVPERAWRRRRAGALFRLLLISPGRALHRDQVAEALWPEHPPDSTPALFHQATSALRRALEPDLPDKFPSRYLTVEEGRVRLHLPEGSWVDFEVFEQHVRRAEWEAALTLYQGELFPPDRYADWAAVMRERLAQRFVRAALEAARLYMETGTPDAALDCCRRILEIEPWQEEAVLLGMQACVALNDRAGALRLYRRLERTLRQELDIAPQATVRRFYRSLL